MEFPEKFNKFYYWIFLILVISIFVLIRWDSIFNGSSAPMDILIFLIWISLLLVPIFEEISLFGVKLKREIDDLKSDLTNQILSLRTDVHNSIDFKTEINPNFYLNPLSDDQLSEIEEKVKEELDKAMEDKGLVQNDEDKILETTDDIKYLFSVRYHIEKEVRRIWDDYSFGRDAKRFSIFRMLQDLTSVGKINDDYAGIINKVLRVCNPAIHGENVTQKQVDFVQQTAPELITLLKSVT